MSKTTANGSKASNASATGTKAIDRAMQVLSSFVEAPQQGITDVAARTGLSPSTVHRIIRAFVETRYLEQDEDTDRYHLGHAALILGQSARESLGFDRALPVLEQLGALTGESVNMGVRDGTDVVVVLRVQSVQPLRFDQAPGTRISLHCSSMGKSILAFSNQPVPSMSYERVTASTITTKKQFRAELDLVRERGFSTDDEESIAGVSCVGAPIVNAEGIAVAAIAVQAPTVRMTPQRQDALASQAVEAAAEIRRILRLETLTSLPVV